MTSSWRVLPLWSLVEESRQAVEPTALGDEVVHYSIPGVDATGRGIVEKSETIKSAKLLLRGGEVLVSKLNPRKSRVVHVSPSALPVVSSTEFIGLRPGASLDSRFLGYLLKSESVRQNLDARVQSVTRSHQRVSPSDVTHLSVKVPPVAEQRRITGFLDAETALIDRMVSLRTTQLRLLMERSQAYVRSCVTGYQHEGGPSRSINWLGSVPAAWESPILNRVARFIMGTTFPHDYQGKATGDYPFIKVGDFSLADEVGRLGSADNWISRDVAGKLGARVVPAGAVLYARVGAALLLNRRRIAVRPCVIDDNVRAISFTEGDPRYWLNVLSLLDMGQLMNPGPVPSISESQVSAVRVPNPPLEEQSRIADNIERQQFAMRKVEESITRQLALLSERRQGLITAAVTGQIDVSTASGRGIKD